MCAKRILSRLIFTATASAQNAPASSFVISGETAKRIHDFSMINLATAQRIAEACENFARKQNVGISIYILDNEGNHVYMHRMDGQGYVSIVTAEMKARTAVLTHQPSKARMNRVVQNPDTELQQIQIGLYPNAGGLPIIVNDQMIGAIGVGGSPPRLAEGWSDVHLGQACHFAFVEDPHAKGRTSYLQRLPQVLKCAPQCNTGVRILRQRIRALPLSVQRRLRDLEGRFVTRIFRSSFCRRNSDKTV